MWEDGVYLKSHDEQVLRKPMIWSVLRNTT
jgi:hypothetical protein